MTAPSPAALVIGAGPAGLAVAACLGRAGVPCTVLERTDTVGPAWREHYERLHLHTDRDHSLLPGLRYPPDVGRYPSRDEVVAYLEEYARTHRIEPVFGAEVVRATPGGGGGDRAWVVECADERRFEAPALVVATGFNGVPHRPTWPGLEAFAGPVVHSHDYRDGSPYRGQRVLVVGFGNSGGEIAIDLVEHGAAPTLAVRSPVNLIPKEILGVPNLTLGIALRRLPYKLADLVAAPIQRLAFGDVEALGLRRLPYGPLTQIHEHRRIPLIDIGTVDLIRRGEIAVRPGIEHFDETGVTFVDGRREGCDAVVLATGYRPALERFLEPPGPGAVLDDQGLPRASGARTALPGLYFCGFYLSPTGMLREIGLEAERIAGLVAAGETAPA